LETILFYGRKWKKRIVEKKIYQTSPSSQMTEIPEDHPRYHSLITRELIVKGVGSGIISTNGLIAQGRGEAFDYLVGETTIASARDAQYAASAMLLLANRPIT
jgi:4-phosphopantoate--beta-alanine ligase